MKLKNLMSVVRGMSTEWSVMTNQCVIKGCETQTVVKNIIELLSETEESLKIGNILLSLYLCNRCMCDDTGKKQIDGCV